MPEAIKTINEYIESLPPDRQVVVSKIHELIIQQLPGGFEATINYGMIGYVVPHSKYPQGYHCDPKLPLPFMGLASNKGGISLYHMGLYVDEDLMAWFLETYTKETGKKPDIGKSCIRFKKLDQIPMDTIGSLCRQVSPDQWIALYERMLKSK